MRVGVVLRLTGVVLGALCWPCAQASSQVACRAGPDALGVARTLEIDTAQGPKFGSNQHAERHFLRDREVVLTFDDGPHAAYTRPILEALEAQCTRATFFMVGWRALSQPGLVRDAARRGHTIGTHGWTHRNVATLSPAAARTEIELGISAVQHALGAPAAPFFRFPYLADSRAATAHLRSRNTAIFSIDIDAYDYRTRSPTMVLRNVLEQLAVKRRGIILLHDIQPASAGAIRALLAELKARGYKIVHLRPAAGQVTVAEFDRDVQQNYAGRRLASLPVPVGQRGIVSPAWEVNVFPIERANGTRGSLSARAPRRPPDDNWFLNIFRNW
jgi:peptidoglycan/xylan/chitin deacetylase (PgdA/CDA1 family)